MPTVKCGYCEVTTFMSEVEPALPAGWIIVQMPDYLDVYVCPTHANVPLTTLSYLT